MNFVEFYDLGLLLGKVNLEFFELMFLLHELELHLFERVLFRFKIVLNPPFPILIFSLRYFPLLQIGFADIEPLPLIEPPRQMLRILNLY